jgi:translation initiation factor IF-3
MRLAEDVEDLAVIEQRPIQDGRNMTMLLGPSHKKVQDSPASQAPAKPAAPPSADAPARPSGNGAEQTEAESAQPAASGDAAPK